MICYNQIQKKPRKITKGGDSLKGNIFDIQRFSLHDGPGIRTTVFLKGCPLSCAWCHNPEGLSTAENVRFFPEKCIGCSRCGGRRGEGEAELCPAEAQVKYLRSMSLEELLPILLADRDFYRDGGGVSFSGGECLLQYRFVLEVEKLLRREGVGCVIDTSGCVPWEAFEATLPYTDIYLYDVKAADSELHFRYTGRGNEQIIENLQRLSDRGARIKVRVPVIPSVNDSDEEMTAIRDIIAPLGSVEEVTLIPYHTLGKSKYATVGLTPRFDAPYPITEARLRELRELFSPLGIPII